MKTRRAVVLGGGFGGLVVARVLTDTFDEVWVIERDTYPDKPAPRARVPQGAQVHVLLARGLQILQELFPTLGQRFDEVGVPEVDLGADLVQLLGDVEMPRNHAGIPMRCCPRPLLEALIRQLVEALPAVRILQGTTAGEILLDERGCAHAVALSGEGAPREPVSCDLVVDCRGRQARLPQWLEAAGFEGPRSTVINAGFAYGTVVFEPARPREEGSPEALFCAPRFPDFPVAGMVVHQPDGTLIATHIGAQGHHAPHDLDAFVDTFREMPSPELWKLLKDARPLTGIARYGATANRRWYVEELRRWPGRYVALGDTVCALNPRFGQGMTVAAASAKALQRHLAESGIAGLDRAPVAFAQGFQRRLGKVLDVPWLMATSEDASWIPSQRQGLKDRLVAWYFQGLLTLASRDPDACIRFMRVAQMLDGPAALLHPSLSLRILLGGARPQPAALPQPA